MRRNEYSIELAAQTPDGNWRIILRHLESGLVVEGEGVSRWTLQHNLIEELNLKVKNARSES